MTVTSGAVADRCRHSLEKNTEVLPNGGAFGAVLSGVSVNARLVAENGERVCCVLAPLLGAVARGEEAA